jgi:PKD repeat protein
MKMKLFLIASIALLLVACKKNDPQLGTPPTVADATFTATPTVANVNVLDLTASNPSVLCLWDLGNGMKAQGTHTIATYPYAGTYTIKLTVFNNGGSRSSTQVIVIAQDDYSLLNNPIYTMLTGGASGIGYKTWVIDSMNAGHMGVGPDPVSASGNIPEWWAAGANDKAGTGLYNDRYVFHLGAFKFDMLNQGDVYIHNGLAALFPGSFQNLGDFTAPYTNQMNESWNLVEDLDTTITISNNAFIGFYTGVKTYRILSITDTSLLLQYSHFNGGLNWYLRLVPE